MPKENIWFYLFYFIFVFVIVKTMLSMAKSSCTVMHICDCGCASEFCKFTLFQTITQDNRWEYRYAYIVFSWEWITVLKLKHVAHAGPIMHHLFLQVLFHDLAALSIYYMVTLIILPSLLMHKNITQGQYKLQCFI